MLLIKFSPYIAANLTKIFLEPNNLIFKHIIPSLKIIDLYLVGGNGELFGGEEGGMRMGRDQLRDCYILGASLCG